MSTPLKHISVDDVVKASRCILDERGRLYLPRELREHLAAEAGEKVLALKGNEGEILLVNKTAVERLLR